MMNQTIKTLYLILSYLGTAVAIEAQYVIRPSQSQGYCCDQCNNNLKCTNNSLTLSQFVNNVIDYLTSDTTLIISPGNYRLKSELVVENIHSFSMFGWPSLSSKAIIVCSHSARFEFSNVSIVTASGLEFVGCFENSIVSVGQFQLEDSDFYGNSQTTVNVTVLTIDESVANLDKVAFISIAEQPSTLPENCNATISIACTHRVIGILLKRSTITIMQSWFKGIDLGLGGVIYDEFNSDITIINTTFVNNLNNITNDVRYYRRDYLYVTEIPNGNTGSIVYVNSNESTIKIHDSKFANNVGVVIFGNNCSMLITNTKFINNKCSCNWDPFVIYVTDAHLAISHSTFTNNTGRALNARYTIMNISHSEFVDNLAHHTTIVTTGASLVITHSTFTNNTGYVLDTTHTITIISCSEFVSNNAYTANAYTAIIVISDSKSTSIDHSKFINNTGTWMLAIMDINMISITHSELVDNNNMEAAVILHGDMMSLSQNKFVNNRASGYIVWILYYHNVIAVNLPNNVFINNSAAFEVYINPECSSGFSLSLGSPHCLRCSENWHRDLIGIVVAAFIAGIALVVFILALNMTVAVGTLNGILFYAHIISANAETYFEPFTAPNFISVFISWLNLDIGFDACFFIDNQDQFNFPVVYKTLIQLAFPVYINILVILVIVASECSSKFAKIIGKGNPVAVLATMILVSYAKFFNATLTSISFSYLNPAYGSRNLDVTRLGNLIPVARLHNTKFEVIGSILIVALTLLFLLCIIYSVLVLSWQWLLGYQDKAIFKWVRYQKLHHFLEPYHTPYTANYRYWTGLLLFVRALLYIISALNFSLDPRVDLMSTIFIVGGLILLKGVTAKRIYKNWPTDVMETAIYFNLVAFSALTWYNLDFGGNQVAAAYTSVNIIFILLLGVIIFHIFRYTRLFKGSFVEKAFKWISSKLLEKKPEQESLLNDAPELLDGYQIERGDAGDQKPTYSVVKLSGSAEDQEVTY